MKAKQRCKSTRAYCPCREKLVFRTFDTVKMKVEFSKKKKKLVCREIGSFSWSSNLHRRDAMTQKETFMTFLLSLRDWKPKMEETYGWKKIHQQMRARQKKWCRKPTFPWNKSWQQQFMIILWFILDFRVRISRILHPWSVPNFICGKPQLLNC